MYYDQDALKCVMQPKKMGRTNGVSILTGMRKSQFSCINSIMFPDSNGTKFTVEVLSS